MLHACQRLYAVTQFRRFFVILVRTCTLHFLRYLFLNLPAFTPQELARLPNVKEVKINTVWTPKWDPRVHSSEVAQMLLGLI